MRHGKDGPCEGRGYLISWYHYGAKARPQLKQCCDITEYSRAVQAMACLTPSPKGAPCPVIPLRPRQT
jgi:hypothetical protein